MSSEVPRNSATVKNQLRSLSIRFMLIERERTGSEIDLTYSAIVSHLNWAH